MDQYWQIKKTHADVVIFFKVGKFYELFEEDALLGHRELDLAFMGKESPHVGFPEAVLPKYAQKLVALGYKVGVVEQMETPNELAERNKTAKKKDKAVRRELCSILTKGTAENFSPHATYLLSVTEDLPLNLLGVCFIDVASGRIFLGQCEEEEGKQRLKTLLAQLQPAEIVVNATHTSSETRSILRRSVAGGLLNELSADKFSDIDSIRSALTEGGYFRPSQNENVVPGSQDELWPSILRAASLAQPPVAFNAFGGCLYYLKRLLLDKQVLPLIDVSEWHPCDGDGNDAPTIAPLVLDGKTLENLEVFQNLSDGSSKGTLFSLIDHTCTAPGKRLLREWMCAPPGAVKEIAHRQEAISSLMDAPELADQLRKTFRRLPDLERLLTRVHSFSVVQASNSATYYQDVGRKRLNQFIKALEGLSSLDTAIESAQTLVSDDMASSLLQLLRRPRGFPNIAPSIQAFRNAFDWEQAKSAGRVVPLPGNDAAYDEASAAVDSICDDFEGILEKWRTRLKDKSISFWTPGGSTTEPYQLAVSEETLKRRGTPEELVQVSSKKGTRRFHTDEIKERVDAYLAARAKQEAALSAIATKLYADFAADAPLWRAALRCASQLDCLLALAKFSAKTGMCRPLFVEDSTPFLDIREGANACVEAAMEGGECIRNDIRLGVASEAGSPRFLLVTGPNMGGKSTVLRQACITTILAHLGCWVPATSCALSPVDRIFTRIGANDAIMAGLSTFRVELEETSLILRHATERSLVILDELGRGTATYDGMAIAHGVMEHLVHKTGCLSLFATHYHALSREFEIPNPHIALFHMACVVNDEDDVTFLYRFLPGACNRSHGVHVARLAGIPDSLLELASERSNQMELALEDMYACQLARRFLSSTANAATLWHEATAAFEPKQ